MVLTYYKHMLKIIPNNKDLRHFFCTLSIFFTFLTAKSQTVEHIIELNNGLIIQGIVLEMVPNQYIKLQQLDKVNTILMSDIKSMKVLQKSIEPKPIEQTPATYYYTNRNRAGGGGMYNQKPAYKDRSKLKPYPDSGLVNFTSIGITMGSDQFNSATSSFSFNTVFSYPVYKRINLGVMAGIDLYGLYQSSINNYALDVRYFTKKSPTTMFFAGQGGYGLNMSRGNPVDWGGAFFSINFGRVTRSLSNNSGTFWSFGYRFQKFQSDRIRDDFWQWTPVTRDINHYNTNRIDFRFGLIF